jgi:protein-tyrosine kinase
MSIIENALKKAGKQDLIIQANGEDCQTSDPQTSLMNSVKSVLSPESTQDVHADNHPENENHAFINWEKLAKVGFLDNNDTRSVLSEEFRVIKRPLMNNIESAKENGIRRANLILICSSLPEEGKTYISINLALSFANERDKNVLLIDADVEKPSISKRLGIKDSPGLIEYLENPEVKFSDILLKTDLTNLSVIPAGKKHKYSTELLSSQRMYSFAEEISTRYKDRIIILDSPPLLVTTQAQVLAELVGQVVLVIAAESTPQSIVGESIAKLSNCDVVMTLLNKTRKEFDFYRLDLGYGKYGR